MVKCTLPNDYEGESQGIEGKERGEERKGEEGKGGEGRGEEVYMKVPKALQIPHVFSKAHGLMFRF